MIFLLFIIALAFGLYYLTKTGVKGVIGLFSDIVNESKVNNLEDEDKTNLEILKNEDDPLKVQIKDNNFDSSKIIAYEGEEIQAFEFRPQTWEQFISQTNAKEQAKTIMKKVKKGIRSHFILSAIKGHGKTTFIELFAKSINAKLIQRVGKQIDEDELLNIVNEINTCEEKNVVFFIDEIDSMDWKVIKVLNPIIEQFKINEKRIKPFIFASATINKHILIKNNPDTLDRIPHHIQFNRYSADDVAKIIKQYKDQLYADEKVTEEIITQIAKSCKFNPRTSISLLEDFIVEKDVNKILKNRHILKDGLTETDIKILKALNQATRAMGANSLAMGIGLSELQYLSEYEPFLVEFGYIARIPSRVITEKGKKYLKEIK